MSTKSSLCYDENYHIYKEIFDNKNIYLELSNLNSIDLNIENNKSLITISLDIEIFKKLLSDINKCKINFEFYNDDNNEISNSNLDYKSIDLFQIIKREKDEK